MIIAHLFIMLAQIVICYMWGIVRDYIPHIEEHRQEIQFPK